MEHDYSLPEGSPSLTSLPSNLPFLGMTSQSPSFFGMNPKGDSEMPFGIPALNSMDSLFVAYQSKGMSDNDYLKGMNLQRHASIKSSRSINDDDK